MRSKHFMRIAKLYGATEIGLRIYRMYLTKLEPDDILLRIAAKKLLRPV